MKTLFAFCVFFLLAGSRFSDGAIAAGIFRSVHAVDLLFPVLLLCCARQLRATVASMPSTVHGLWLLWLAYCVSFAQLGHFVTGLAIEGEPLIVSLLFAAKELEFYVLMMFAAMVASLHPRFATRVCWTILVGLAIWIPIDLLAPSGYYLLGLPWKRVRYRRGSSTGCAHFLPSTFC